MCEVEKGADIYGLDLKAGAEKYLTKGGLTSEQIDAVEACITG